MADGWKKIWWMVGGRSGGWLEEDLVDDWMKIWWMVGRLEDLLDDWKIWWMVRRRSVG